MFTSYSMKSYNHHRKATITFKRKKQFLHSNQQIMKMTGREPPISISDGNLIMIGVVIMTVFVIVLILVMINDYRLYLGNHWKKKYSFADFVKQEQFYIYILLFFLLLVGSELLLQNEYSF